MDKEEKISIPTLIKKGKNSKYKFHIYEYNKNEWIDILEKEIFKDVGKYNLNEEINSIIASEAIKFKQLGYYTDAPFKSYDYIQYWEHQKLLSRKGLQIITDKHRYYITREYYFWINFLPIYHKTKNKYDFPDIMDFQIYMSLYEYIAELRGLHCAILKKRQCASSYYHAAKLINMIWFEEGAVCKVALYAEQYLKQIWTYLEEYKNFLNKNTGWYRNMLPDVYRHWKQQFEDKISGGKKIYKGNKSELYGIIVDVNAMKSVAGACKIFFHDEGGISPLMLDVYEYVLPSLKEGDITTGQFICAGSVGELEYSKGLQELIMYPEKRNIYAVPTLYFNNEHNVRMCGLFIPEHFGMRPYVDEYGNSDVIGAMEYLIAKRKEWKEQLSFDKYQLRISQSPMYIDEAFAYRKESRFPLDIIKIQEDRIKENMYPYEYVDLEYDADGNITYKPSLRIPIMDVPINPSMEDKRACVVIYEHPIKNAKFGTYIASVDPVSSGKTITSTSLASIYVYRMPTVRTVKHKSDIISNNLEGDKIVCSWAGRYDDINDTFDNLLKIIEYYNAYTLVENNSWNFIQHVIYKKKQHYLIPSNKILFTKEINLNTMTFKEYGYSTTMQMFKNHLIPNLIDYIKEKIGEEYNEDKTVKRTIFGVERILDIMALEEMKKFDVLDNTDRLISLASLIAYVKVLTSNFGYVQEQEHFEKTTKNVNLNYNYFKNIKVNKHRSFFKNLK